MEALLERFRAGEKFGAGLWRRAAPRSSIHLQLQNSIMVSRRLLDSRRCTSLVNEESTSRRFLEEQLPGPAMSFYLQYILKEVLHKKLSLEILPRDAT